LCFGLNLPHHIISVNGVAPPAAKSCTGAKVTDVKCHPVGEENEIHSGHEEVLPSGNDDEGTKWPYYPTFKHTSVVTYRRLHCTVCSCYIGCTPVACFTMAFHEFLHVLICKGCETFYGNGEFACGDDGSSCDQCGHLYCCSIHLNVFCYQGEKLPFYRASHPLRPIVFPSTRQGRNCLG